MDRMWLSFLLLVFSMLVVIALIISTTTENHDTENSDFIEKRSSNFEINITTKRTQIKMESVSSDTESHRKNENLNILNDAIPSAVLHGKHHNRVGRSEAGSYVVDFNVSFKEGKNVKTRLYKRNILRNNTGMDTKEKQQWNNKSITATGNFSFCSFSFDKNSLQETRKKLAELQQQSANMFYVSLYTDTNLDSFSTQQRDNLLHWQYVLKKEQFLTLLPVDFELLTFNWFLNEKNAEKVLRMKILYNTSKCIENFSHAFRSLQLLLWNELFANDTNYYLCHNNFEGVTGRTILYVITSTWIGYDLSCSSLTNIAENEFEAKKDALIFSAHNFCYFLALQFVWVFLILDISYENKQTGRRKYEAIYTRNEKPFSIKQFIYKLLFYDHDLSTCRFLDMCRKPITRLICMLLFCNLIIGIYRTFGRYSWSKMVFVDYLNVVRPNEFLVYLIYLMTDLPPVMVLVLDLIYAVIFPFSFLWFGEKLYDLYLLKDGVLCPQSLCLDKKEEDKMRTMNASFSNNIIFPYYLLCAREKLWSFDCNIGRKLHICTFFFSSCLPICPFNCNTFYAFDWTCYSCEYLLKIIAFSTSFLFCLRPIISSFTFLFRSFTYIMFVALPIRPEIMRGFLLAVTLLVYFIKYINEIINMNAEILECIFKEKESENELESYYVGEKMFSAISRQLLFMRKKIYFVLFKMGIIFAYLYFTIDILRGAQLSIAITGYNVKDIVEVVLIAVGPYAISLFIKAKNDNFLTSDDKEEIKKEYISYMSSN